MRLTSFLVRIGHFVDKRATENVDLYLISFLLRTSSGNGRVWKYIIDFFLFNIRKFDSSCSRQFFLLTVIDHLKIKHHIIQVPGSCYILL